MASAIGATLAGISDLLRASRDGLEVSTEHDLSGLHAVVTGANRGLGLAIATSLAHQGARVTLACRSGIPEAGEVVRARTGSDAVFCEPLDLGELASVQAFTERLAEGPPIDRLVLNAGVVPRTARRTADGLNQLVQINYLANVLLVERLLADGTLPRHAGARLVAVSSESHRSAEPLDLTDLGAFTPHEMSQAISRYGRSKLLLQTWLAELDRREAGAIAVHSLCPGPIASGIAREAPAWMRPPLNAVMRLAFQSPEVAARPVSWLVGAPELDGESGAYLHMRQRKEPAPTALDPDQGARLWRASRALLERLAP